jgi:hypothetical protein
VFLNAGGAMLSMIGVLLAIKRVTRSVKRMIRIPSGRRRSGVPV